MRLRTAASIFVLIASAIAGDTVLTIEDVSGPGSPLRNSGTATLVEQPSGANLAKSVQGRWTVTNVSTKNIVALVESLSVQYPSGARQFMQERYEFFFDHDLMKPHATVTFEAGGGVEVGPPPSGPPVQPRCEVTTLWVQFDDGRTFGDPKQADSFLKDRRASIEAMAHLRGDGEQGSNAFVAELKNPSIPKEAGLYDMLVQQLRTDLEQRDAQVAYRKLQQKLDVAQSRAALLN